MSDVADTGDTGYRYGDRGAALLMRLAKHDVGPAGIVHAARHLTGGRPLTIHTERKSPDPLGQMWTTRGEFHYAEQPESIDVRRGADETATLGHELVHYALRGRPDRPGGDEEEALGDYVAGQQMRLRELPDQDERQRLRELGVQLLGPDLSRAAGESELDAPSAVDRLNAQKLQERDLTRLARPRAGRK